ncbi:MAG: glycosyltransferase [Paludibacteraceae bacterium]
MELKNNHITVYAGSNPQYAGFYISYLEACVSKSHITFSRDAFMWNHDRVCGTTLALLIYADNSALPPLRLAIDTGDGYDMDEEAYQWCDTYAKINYNQSKTPQYFQVKTISICPSFAVKSWGLVGTIYHAIYNAMLMRPTNIRKFLGKYKHCYLRIPLQEYYQQAEVDERYVFFCSTFWYNEPGTGTRNDDITNRYRANFIRACKSIEGLKFEGGLVVHHGSNVEKYPDVVSVGYSHADYIRNIKRSIIAFNTPALWDCHGWKLGEFLAMGKAIISTPLSNDLPAPLEHGVNIHFVDGSEESIREAVLYIAENKTYRRRLEGGGKSILGAVG